MSDSDFVSLTFTVPVEQGHAVCAAVAREILRLGAVAVPQPPDVIVNGKPVPAHSALGQIAAAQAARAAEPKPAEVPLPPGVVEFAAAQAAQTAAELVETLGEPATEKRKLGRPRKPAAVEGVPNEPAMAATPPKPKPAPLAVVKDEEDPFAGGDEPAPVPAAKPAAAATPPTVAPKPAPGDALELLKQTMSAYVRSKGLPGLQKAFAAMGYKVLSDVPESAYGAVVESLRKDIGA